MSDYTRSLIRTIVPLIVGAVVGWLATHGVRVDEAAILPTVDSVVAAGYYAVARALEHRWPALGWLLGAPGAPTYGPGLVAFAATPAAATGEIPPGLQG